MKPLYHGGARRLDRKKLILPPSVTGARSTASYGGGGVCRTDRVYVITELDQARVFALMVGRGDVYQVQPVGEMVPDPDYSGPGESWECELARIVRVVERNVTEVDGLGVEDVLTLVGRDI